MSQPSGLTTPLVLTGRDRLAPHRADMKTRHVLAVVLGALAAGIGSGWALLGEKPPFGAVHLGSWQSFPRIGSSDVDPYGRAILARGPHLPLAAGEGIQLIAQSDSAGAPLEGRCRYRLSGMTLPSRGWTLTVTDKADRVVPGTTAAMSDADLISDESGQLMITVSAKITSGAWLGVPPDGRFGLILRFYDTPFSASIGQLPAQSLPRIERLSCAEGG